ncbi:MAG TPA: vWA domain-containing protein [Polyangiaceae bacterium]|nr:vWA domain-containing protein [Polyangiaceae bacterium]
MKALSSVLSLFVVISTVACSANDTAAPATPGKGGSNGAQGGSSGTTGGSSGVTTGGKAAGTGGTPGGIDVPVGGGGGEQNCGFQNFNLKREPADILLVLDRSASMEDAPDGATDPTSKWNLVVPALTEVVSSTDSSVAWGMKSYPEGEGNECIAGSVTTKIDVAIAPSNASAVNQAIMTTTPKGNGTPTGDAVKQAVVYMKTVTNTHPKFLLLATDGEPSCAGTTKDSTQARTYAVQAVTDALAAGFPTYVVGVATTKTSATTALNNMASAGGKPRADTNPLATRYYLANTKDELVKSLQTITGEVAKSCTFALNPPPPAPNFIAVKVAGQTVMRDPDKGAGWEYTSTDYTQLEVYGAACEAIKSDADKVEIIYGCEGIIPK